MQVHFQIVCNMWQFFSIYGTRNLRNQHTYMYCIHLVIFSGYLGLAVWCGVSHCVEDVYSWAVQFGDGMLSPWHLFHIRSFSYVHIVTCTSVYCSSNIKCTNVFYCTKATWSFNQFVMLPVGNHCYHTCFSWLQPKHSTNIFSYTGSDCCR